MKHTQSRKRPYPLRGAARPSCRAFPPNYTKTPWAYEKKPRQKAGQNEKKGEQIENKGREIKPHNQVEPGIRPNTGKGLSLEKTPGQDSEMRMKLNKGKTDLKETTKLYCGGYKIHRITANPQYTTKFSWNCYGPSLLDNFSQCGLGGHTRNM